MNTPTSNRCSVLVVDDDIFSLAMIREELLTGIPGVDVTCRENADLSGDFDVFLIDNDFHGSPLAVSLTEQLRLRCPNALVIVFSSSLTRDCLKALLNAGCDAVAEKAEPRDRAMALDLVKRFIEARARPSTSARVPVLAAAAQLLREWNRRLEISGSMEVARG